MTVGSRFFYIALIALAVVSILVNSPQLAAQDLDNVTMTGRVLDQNGAVIPGATVTATLVSTGIERTVVTDGEGRYRLIQLPPGNYNLKIFFPNFAPEERVGLTIISGQNLQMDITLQPPELRAGALVISEGDTPPVDTTRTVVGGT
ncbi:MAG: carboxypeptidase-like regulatory domain-containing protein, partial [bacterium]